MSTGAMATAAPALRIGILGCANIARQFARDVAGCPDAKVVAVGSRNAETAGAFATACGIEHSHGSYGALLADSGVDVIYLPLPNSLHAEWAVSYTHLRAHET
jgi:predicted dehydrogenase